MEALPTTALTQPTHIIHTSLVGAALNLPSSLYLSHSYTRTHTRAVIYDSGVIKS